MALTMAHNERNYVPGPIVHWFHSFPHVDIMFRQVNSTFDPSSTQYLESLGILAALPGFLLILNLLAFLVYFFARCCQKEWTQKKDLKPLKWTLGVLAILCCGAVGVGFYGNDEAHKAVDKFTDSVGDVQDTITSVKNKTMALQNRLNVTILPEFDKLDNIFKQNSSVQSALQKAVGTMRDDVQLGVSRIAGINNKIGNVNMGVAPRDIKRAEDFRWPVTMATLSLFMLLCVLVLLGVIRHSRPILIWFSALALIVIIVNWVLVSVYLAVGVALGDLCTDPEPFIRSRFKGKLEDGVVEYYLDCGSSTQKNPFQDAIDGGKSAVENVETTLTFVKNTSFNIYNDTQLQPTIKKIASNLNVTIQILNGVSVLLNCQQIHKDYEKAIESTCGPFLFGVAFLLMSAVLAGIFFLLLEWVASNTWIYIKKKTYVQVDEQDPFLPQSVTSNNPRRGRDSYGSTGYRPRHSHTPPQTPPFPGSHNGRIPRIEESLHGRYTPPPSYEQLTGGLVLPTAPLDT